MSAEVETKKILLEAYKERQQKATAAGAIPSFYKKAISCPSQCMFCMLFWDAVVLDQGNDVLSYLAKVLAVKK